MDGQIIVTSPEELKRIISDSVREALAANSGQSKQTEKPEGETFLSRREASKFLRCTIGTIDNWVKAGILTSYRIGSNVRFKQSELVSVPK